MIRKIEKKDIPTRTTHYNNLLIAEIKEFVGTDWPAAEIDIAKYKSATTASAAYKKAVKRMGAPVKVISRNGRAFLLREAPRT